MELRLVIAGGRLAGKEIRVKDRRFVIGRSEGCHLRLQHTEVSRKHCAVSVEDSGVTVEDCGSTNGTFVNEQRIQGRHALREGDQIRVGILKLQVHLVAGTEPAQKPKPLAEQETVIRKASTTPASSDDIDISDWIGDASTLQLTTPAKTAPGDTVSGKSLVDTTLMSKSRTEQEKKEKSEKGTTPTKGGKARRLPPKPTTADSGTAADDALRQFFHRRKP